MRLTPPGGIMLMVSTRRKTVGWQGGDCMSAEENMALARRFIEALVKGDLDAMDEMMSPDFVNHTKLLPGQEPGPEGERWAIAQISTAISNVSVLVEDQVAAG